MYGPKIHREGLSLLELIVTLTIIAILIAFLLVAANRARFAARRVENINNIHEIGLACQNYASTIGSLPKTVSQSAEGQQTIWGSLLPYIDPTRRVIPVTTPGVANIILVPIYVNPADPSVLSSLDKLYTGAISYGSNSLIFYNRPQPISITDGLSNTIGFAEHYSICGKVSFNAFVPGSFNKMRRATFAESYTTGESRFLDIYPLTSGSPPISSGWTGNVQGLEHPSTLTFQAGPRPADCNSSVAQGPDSSGMQVGLMDGSVRMIRANVEASTYWALVTPRAGDLVGDY